MCGIIGAVGTCDVVPILLDGLRGLEYRGYDSAGLAVIDSTQRLVRERTRGKVTSLVEKLNARPLSGTTGIAHTRWATHGAPSEKNAHPHVCGSKVAIVHNGIIENHESLRREVLATGAVLESETDSEVIAHLIAREIDADRSLLDSVAQACHRLEGAFAIEVASPKAPDALIVVRIGSPLVVGIGDGEAFVASDLDALLDLTDRFVVLEEGDIAEVRCDGLRIFSLASPKHEIKREVLKVEGKRHLKDKGEFDTFMHKEIYEQPEAAVRALESRISGTRVLQPVFGVAAERVLSRVRSVHIVAAGSSHHCGLIAKYWIEDVAGLPCQVEVASEFRYRKAVVLPGSLFVAISQSGETADTLAALRISRRLGFVASLAICNVPTSTLVRESDMTYLMQAGPEFSVASTKAISCSLVGLLLLTLLLGRSRGHSPDAEAEVVEALHSLDDDIREALALEPQIETLAAQLIHRNHVLFLGRGPQYPVALEAALKLKEISYIHAEGYPAGELKHGPLALIDESMPVIVIAPKDDLIEKLASNVREVEARGGELIVFASQDTSFAARSDMHVLPMPRVHELLAPIVYNVPLQLLAYHVARRKGTDIDQPRNLAKAVTVE